MRKEKIEVLDKEDIPKTNKINIILICIIIIGLVGVGLVFVRNSQEKKLNTISKELTIDNAINDNIDSNIHTIFIYSKVEKALKDYYIRYGKDYNKINSIMEESELINILSINNYKDDGPEFNVSFDYINKKKKEFDKYIDDLMKISTEEYINSYIEKYTKFGYSKKLYKDIIDRKKLINTLESKYGENKRYKEKVDKQFDGVIETLEFLKENKDNWKIESNVIKFNKSELLEQYNKLISEYKK